MCAFQAAARAGAQKPNLPEGSGSQTARNFLCEKLCEIFCAIHCFRFKCEAFAGLLLVRAALALGELGDWEPMPNPSAVCAACSLLLAGLSRVAEISAPAHSTSPGKRPSPNAHTRRWLQGVDKVSVRAEVEDELELVCGRLALRSVRDECVELVEEHEDELVRAVLDGDGVGLCSTLVGSCGHAAQTAAVTRHTHAIRSESVRADGAAADANGHVPRLSGHSFEGAVLGRPGHVLLLLYNSEPAVVAAGLPDPVGPAYVEAWREFHKLSAQLGGSVGELAFATLDLRLNDGPALPTQPLPFQQAHACCRRRPSQPPNPSLPPCSHHPPPSPPPPPPV